MKPGLDGALLWTVSPRREEVLVLPGTGAHVWWRGLGKTARIHLFFANGDRCTIFWMHWGKKALM